MNALIKKGMLVTVLALSVNTAMAAQSIDIKVTGKIIPSSCTPAFPSGGGIADFGTMKVASLNATSVTPLTERKDIPVSITCEEATRVAVKFTDA
jgi:type 1 fimbria pilin